MKDSTQKAVKTKAVKHKKQMGNDKSPSSSVIV